MHLMSNGVAKPGRYLDGTFPIYYKIYILEYSTYMLEISTNNISLCNIDNITFFLLCLLYVKLN